MNLGLLALLAIVVLLLLFAREGFEATNLIKDPATWDGAEIDRIRKLVTPETTLAATEVRNVIGGFWSYTHNGQLKGWKHATLQVTMDDINDYLNSRGLHPSVQGPYRALLKAYYIDQGQSVFQSARGYNPSTALDIQPSSPPPPGTTLEVGRPISTDPKLRMTVASYSGIPGNNTGEIDKYITYVQRFYDNYYLPNKQPPTQLMIQDFVRSIPASEFPTQKRASLEAIIDNWFTQFQTPASLLALNPQSQQQRSAPTTQTPSTTTIQTTTQTPTTSQPMTTFTPPEPQKQGTKIFGPVWKGFGKSVGDDEDGNGRKRRYPTLLGGTPEGGTGKEFDLPSADSLGLNNGSQFLPFSRSPGDQDGVFSKFRIGNAFQQPSKTDPVPALTDFSAFQ